MRRPTPARLEAFSDGVIAVIITIMVLELKVPATAGPAGLLSVAPTLGIYALSFIFAGIYWINHGHLIDRIRTCGACILWANLGLLFALSLMPFFTANVVAHRMDSFSVQVYAAEMLFCGLMFEVLTLAVGLELGGHVEDADVLREHRSETRKGLVSVGCYLAAGALAPHSPRGALGLVALVTVIWITPGLGTGRAVKRAAALQANRPNPEPAERA